MVHPTLAAVCPNKLCCPRFVRRPPGRYALLFLHGAARKPSRHVRRPDSLDECKTAESCLVVMTCSTDGGGAALAALLGDLTAGGASVTLSRCDVAAAEETASVAASVDAVMHAGGVLRVTCCRC